MSHPTVRRHVVAALVAAGLVLAGCGTDQASQDLCANAKAFGAAVTDLQSLKPDGAKIDELNAKVDAALAKLDRFQAVTEGRFDSAVSTLRANLAGFKQTLAAAGNDAFDTAAPQLTASLDELRASYATLTQSLAVQCPST
jgi:outer membrane murein-binding lipoprotein Lpp